MVKPPLFVSYFTPDYRNRANALIRSLRKQGLEFEIEAIEEKGSWQKDSQYKAKFIWDKLTRHFDKVLNTGRPIVWIDADAEVLSYPYAFEHTECDIAVCEFKHPDRDLTELLSGTIYFRNNIKTHKLVDRWIEICNENPQMWDQRALRKALNAFADDGLRITFLPVSYTYIFDTHRKLFPDVEPIIVHYQESRQAKTRKPYME